VRPQLGAGGLPALPRRRLDAPLELPRSRRGRRSWGRSPGDVPPGPRWLARADPGGAGRRSDLI